MQGIDYTYTITGALKTINDPTLTQAKDPGNDANDAFGMQLHYYANDYTCKNNSTGNTTLNKPNMVFSTPTLPAQNYYDGNISVNLSKTKIPGSVPTTNTYTYAYDYHNWMKKADFGYIFTDMGSHMIINTGEYSETGSNTAGIQYDLNGNIMQLKRTAYTNAGSNAMDNLTYTYYPFTNRLRQVTDADGDKGLGDLASQTDPDNYTYNKIGQLVSNTQDNSQYFQYNAYGTAKNISKWVTIGANTYNPNISLYYDAQGFRTKKIEKRPKAGVPNAYFTYTTYYVNDVNGNPVAVYGTGGKEMPIYASGRVGSIKDNGTTVSYEYELTDHLDNVRVVIPRAAPTTFNTFANYYPFGMNMPSHTASEWQKNSLNPTYYRYGYQGQFAEKDQETGLNSFDLRMWDARIARWQTKDPAGQYWSSYMGMGNRPSSLVDPDGAFTTRAGAWFYNIFHFNGQGSIGGNRDDGFSVAYGYETTTKEGLAAFDYTHVLGRNKDVFDKMGDLFGKYLDVDVRGAAISAQIGGIGALGYGLEWDRFYDGVDKGYSAIYKYPMVGMGLGMGAGGTISIANFIGAKGDAKLTMDDYKGIFNSYQVGYGAQSFTFFWGNNKGTAELYPLQDKRATQLDWIGIAYSLGPSKPNVGAYVMSSNYTYSKFFNKMFNTHANKYIK